MERKRNRLHIKSAAQKGLTGNWLRGAVLVLVSLLINMFCLNFLPLYAPQEQITAGMTAADMYRVFADMLVPEVITKNYIARVAVFAMLSLMLIPPFSQGLKHYFYICYLGEKPKMTVAFLWYASLGRVFGAIALYISIGIRAVLWGVLIFTLPIAAAMYAGLHGMLWLELIASLATLAACVVFMIRMEAYTPAYYMYALKPELGVRAAVRNSVFITRGRLKECFIFRLSFIPWKIVVFITGNVGHIFFEPYYQTATAGLTDMLISDIKKGEEQAEKF